MGHLRDKVMIKPMSALLLVSSQFILAAWAKPMENGKLMSRLVHYLGISFLVRGS